MVSGTINVTEVRGTSRNGNIDGLRLIAAIGVISLHVGPYPELPAVAGDIIRSAFRWCVPFFFMLTGYYLFDPHEGKWRITSDRFSVPLRAFVLASAIFLPVLLMISGADGINLSMLLRGTNYHLWYLPALIIALLTVHTYQGGPALRRLWWASALIAIGFVAISYFHVFTGKRQAILVTFGTLSGIPAVLLGGWLRSLGNLRLVASLLFAAGVALSIIEIVSLLAFGARPAGAEFLAGTLPLAAGLLGLALTSKDLTPDWFAELGRRESLGIYLYHPLAIILATSALSMDFRLKTDGVAGLPIWILSTLIIMVVLLLLRAGFPKIRNALDGAR